MPRLTTTQKNAISSPDTNLVLIDTTLNAFQKYNGSAWVDVVISNNISTADLTFDGTHYVDLNSNGWSIKNGSDSYFNIKSTGDFVIGKDTVDNSTDTTNKHKNTVVGSQSTIAAASIQQATSIGYNNTVNTTNGLALGHSNTVNLGTSIGTSNANTSYNGIALGSSNTISNTGVVAIGSLNQTSQFFTQMLGWRLNPLHDHVTMLGRGDSSLLNSTASKQFIVGWDSPTPTILIGATSDSYIKTTGELSLESNGLLIPRLTTAQMNAISTPSTDLLVFNTDLDCVMRYNGTAWTTFDSPKYIVRSGGTNTPYSNFKTAVDDAPAGAVLEVHTSEVIDVGMPSTYWNWTKDLTIQTNGHDVILTNLSRIQIAAASNLNTLNIIGGGTFSSSHNQVFTIYRNLTINSDGATNIVSTSTGGVLFQPLSNVAGTTFIVNNVKSVGVYFSFTRNNNLQHYTTLNNCHIDLTNSTTNASIVNHLRITANNCTFKHTGGSITYPQNSAFPTVIEDEAFIFNNCTTVGNYGRCMLRLNNCSITTITTTNSGIYQVTLEANNTSFRNINTGSPSNLQGFAIMTSTELVILKNCTINSDWGGVYLSGVSSVIDNCIIKSGNSWGVFRYNSGANVSNFLTIKNSTIECGNYSAVGTIYGSLGKQFDISNTTIITSGASSHCLYMNTGTYARFDNLKLKNLATPANILSRADLLTENPQINTLDNLGNIVLA